MINLFLKTNFVIAIILICSNLLLIQLWKLKNLSKFKDIYSSKQKIHSGFIPRSGGIAIIFTIVVFVLFTENHEIKKVLSFILLGSIPVILITLIEDIFNNIKPILRLFFLFCTSVILINYSSYNLPIIDLPILNEFFNRYSFLLIITLIFSLVGLCNGFNLIDGVNGLHLVTCISIILSLLKIASYVNDIVLIKLFSLILLIYSIQLPFNFPKSFIFLGDLGAYFSGILIGFLVIIFFGANNSIPSWNIVIILFYPIFELFFSIIRRALFNKPILKADTEHLHHLIYSYLINKTRNSNLSNSLTTVLMTPVWIFPFIWYLNTENIIDIQKIIFGIIMQIVIYLSFYLISHKAITKNKVGVKN